MFLAFVGTDSRRAWVCVTIFACGSNTTDLVQKELPKVCPESCCFAIVVFRPDRTAFIRSTVEDAGSHLFTVDIQEVTRGHGYV